MIQFSDGEWIITTPNGYYTSSDKGDLYLKVKVGGKDYNIEQLRESFFRPDLVREALCGGSLNEYRQLADVKQPPTVSIMNTPASVKCYCHRDQRIQKSEVGAQLCKKHWRGTTGMGCSRTFCPKALRGERTRGRPDM